MPKTVDQEHEIFLSFGAHIGGLATVGSYIKSRDATLQRVSRQQRSEKVGIQAALVATRC